MPDTGSARHQRLGAGPGFDPIGLLDPRCRLRGRRQLPELHALFAADAADLVARRARHRTGGRAAARGSGGRPDRHVLLRDANSGAPCRGRRHRSDMPQSRLECWRRGGPPQPLDTRGGCDQRARDRPSDQAHQPEDPILSGGRADRHGGGSRAHHSPRPDRRLRRRLDLRTHAPGSLVADQIDRFRQAGKRSAALDKESARLVAWSRRFGFVGRSGPMSPSCAVCAP